MATKSHANGGLSEYQLANELSDEELATLDANGWDIVDGSYAYLATSVPIDFEAPEKSVRRAAQELHQLGAIVEPHIEQVVEAHRQE
jgi:hypothetical protein